MMFESYALKLRGAPYNLLSNTKSWTAAEPAANLALMDRPLHYQQRPRVLHLPKLKPSNTDYKKQEPRESSQD